MALTKRDFMLAWDLVESFKDGVPCLVDEAGKFVAGVCPNCGEVQASDITRSAGVLQPEYCLCSSDQERRG